MIRGRKVTTQCIALFVSVVVFCLNRNYGTGNSWEICHRCAKILLVAEHKMQLAYYLRNTDWFQRSSEFDFFDQLVIILFTIFY